MMFVSNQLVLETNHPSTGPQRSEMSQIGTLGSITFYHQIDQQLASKQPLKWTGIITSPDIAIQDTVPQVLKTEMLPPELVYNTSVVIQAAVCYQSWSWTTSMETLSSGLSGLVCSLLHWINAQYQTQRIWAIWRLYWQAGHCQQSLEWAILDNSIVLHGAFWRRNLEGLMWSLMHNWRVFAKQVRWNLATKQVWSISQILF